MWSLITITQYYYLFQQCRRYRLQLIRVHSWFVYLYLTILMMMCDLRSPAHQSTFLVAKPQTDASHTSRLSPPRLAMICHSPDQANVSPYPTIQLSNYTTIQLYNYTSHGPDMSLTLSNLFDVSPTPYPTSPPLAPFIIIRISTVGDVYLGDSAHVPQGHV